MSPFRYRDEESSTGTTIAGVLLGAIAGFAVGMFVAQRVGGFSGIAARLKKRGMGRDGAEQPTGAEDSDDILAESDEFDESEEWTDSVAAGTEGAPLLEER